MKKVFLLALLAMFIGAGQAQNTNAQYFLSWDVAPTASTPDFKQEHYSVWISTTGTNPEDFSTMLFEETLSTEHPGWTFENRSVILDDYSNLTVFIAFRHHDVTDMDRIVIDNVMIYKTDDNLKTDQLVFLSEDFEGYDDHEDFLANSGWILIDADDDGHNWFLHFDSVDENFVMVSRSWSSATGPLTPDNWLITPSVLLGTVGMDQLTEIRINVFPNPATSVLSVNSESPIHLVEVVNLLGSLVLSEQVNSSNLRIDVSSLNHGMYFLRAHTDSGIVTRKIQISR